MIVKLGAQFTKPARIILVIALVARAAWAAIIPVVPISDSFAYDALARTLAEYGVYGWTPEYPSAFWPVGTSAIYAMFYIAFGHTYAPIVIFNVCVGAIIVGLTIKLGQLFFDERVALLAGVFMAIWPSEVIYVTVLASELPFTCLILLGFLSWFESAWPSWVRGVTCGLLFAAAIYIRPIALLIPGLLWVSRPKLKRLRDNFPALALTMVLIVLCVVPWSIRNTYAFGHFVALSTNGGAVLWMGNNPQATGFYMRMPPETDAMTEYERDKVLGEEAIRYIFQEPGSFLLRTVRKAVLLHLGETIAVHWNAEGITQRLSENALFPLKVITQSFWIAMLTAGLGGLLVMILNQGLISALLHPIVLTWGYFTAFYATTLVQDRYHFPCHPMIALLAAAATVAIVKRELKFPVRALP